nr:uncharacterized protein LOC106626961 isoform X2 [Bactrocera oleae]
MEKSEYEIQHFNFSVEQFSLEKQKEKVKSKMLSDMEQQLTAIEEMDLKNFSIPDYVLLATDYDHSKQYTEEDEANVDKKLADMKQKFLENSVMIASLKIENAKYEEICTEMNNEEKLLAQIQTALQVMETQWEKVKHLAKTTESLED